LTDLADKQFGASLLELMAVVLIVAIMAVSTMPLLQEQIATREIDAIARRFIAHANFARNQALYLGQSILIAPRADNQWETGWLIQSSCGNKTSRAVCPSKNWFSQEQLFPVYFKGGGKGFSDPHSSQKGILFNAAGAAKTGQGGFVANRLILGHRRVSHLERQLIMGSGGRWRICDPSTDSKGCK
jgi:type IV fimbrial biogenesis protein FimT